MPVDPKDRAAYEEGVEDSKKGIVESLVQNAAELVAGIATLGTNSRTDSESAAYEKGRSGQQLDED